MDRTQHALLLFAKSKQNSEKFLFKDLTACFLKNPNKASSSAVSLPLYSNTCKKRKEKLSE
jgi:hypothetical protein